ncbi:MAG TPA: DUF167 domain-containing protein [Candidatus Nanoarchaeia archaeon]|nr:DUF167 domain-containing protein [Candidatus Nanoarchaeia archaeon]
MEIPQPKDKVLRIIVKPNSPKSEITAVDEARNALRVSIKAPPDKGKANKEVIKFFSKLLKKKVEIVSGLKSKEKMLRIG